jgi:hypothetical protein
MGATVEYQDDTHTVTYTLAQGNIVHESADGVTIKALDEYIIVAYTTNYIPTDKTIKLSSSPLPDIGVYFTEDSSGDYYIRSMSKEGSIKHLDSKYIPDTIARTEYVDEAIANALASMPIYEGEYEEL